VSALTLFAFAGFGKQPNIVVFMADDFGVGCINAYGAPENLVKTPHLNRLAADGMRFTNANTPASVCSPTRYALLTGVYAWRSALSHGVANVYDPLLIDPAMPTLAGYLKSKGYETAQIGKWHLGYGDSAPTDFTEVLKPGPLELGFDYHFGLPQNLDDMLRVWIENDRVFGLRSNRTSAYARSFYGKPYVGFDAPQRCREQASEFLTEKAVEWLRARDNTKPFFLYFASPVAHHPVVPSERMRGKSNCGAYGDFIQDLDWSVGEIISFLEKRGLMENTIFVFTADNGSDTPKNADRPEEQAARAGLKANGDHRGDKHTIYEGGFRVPLIVRWDGNIKAGSITDHMVGVVDLFATLAAVEQGIPVDLPGVIDSSSFADVLFGKEQRERNPMVGNNAAGVQYIRSEKWKYIDSEFPADVPQRMRKGNEKQAVASLYNLKDDPAEQKNLINEYPEVAAQMRALLQEYRLGKGSK